MMKSLTSINSQRCVHVIQDLVQAYNKSYHRAIKTAPAEVNKDNGESGL